MLEIWFSVGYILLLIVLLFCYVLWRRDSQAIAVMALIVGLVFWGWWEYARPTWTTGFVSGTEVRRSDAADATTPTRDVQYVYLRNQADAGLELENEDSWWWLKRNSERVFNNAKTAADRKTEVTVIWNRWRSQIFSRHPNILDFGNAGYWPFWQLRILLFYAVTLAVWGAYFWAFVWLHRRTGDDGDREAI
jgi:hypothetical protein